MYVCGRCLQLIEANDWKGLRDWVGPGAQTEVVRQLWVGFRINRVGPPIFFESGTDPERERY